MPKLWQFSQGHPKPAFSEKVKRGDRGKLLKNSPKSSPRLKGRTALWRKWHYPLISMHLKCKDWKIFLRKYTSPNVPEWPSYGNFRKATENPHFLKNCNGGDQGKFFKIRPKSSPRLKGPKALWRKWHYPLICMRLYCIDWRRFWRKQRLQNCPNGQVMAIFARARKTGIFWRSARGGPREIFQKSPKK